MPEVIFARGSANRKPQFQLVTKIYRSDGKLQVCKSLAHPAAIDHLQSFKHKRELLKNIGCQVAPITKVDQHSIWFEFVRGRSLQTNFEDCLSERNIDGAANIIDSIFNLIDAMPAVTTNPTANPDYIKIFGRSYNAILECTTSSCIDLNLDNFIESGKSLTVIDYEWVYDFPVPKDFLKLRLLHSAFGELDDKLLHTLGDSTVVAYRNLFYLPKELDTKYAKILSGLRNYVSTNTHFLNYLQIVQHKANLPIKKELGPGSGFRQSTSLFADSIDKSRLDEAHIVKQDRVIREQIKIIQQQQSRIAELEQTLSHKTIGRAELLMRDAMRKKNSG